MATPITDIAAEPRKCAGIEKRSCGGSFSVDGAGNVTAIETDDPSVTCGNVAANAVAVTFPTCPKGRLKMGIILSATNAVGEVRATALDLAAGTATLTFYKAGVAATPANTDKFWFELDASVRS